MVRSIPAQMPNKQCSNFTRQDLPARLLPQLTGALHLLRSTFHHCVLQ